MQAGKAAYNLVQRLEAWYGSFHADRSEQKAGVHIPPYPARKKGRPELSYLDFPKGQPPNSLNAGTIMAISVQPFFLSGSDAIYLKNGFLCFRKRKKNSAAYQPVTESRLSQAFGVQTQSGGAPAGSLYYQII